MRRDQRNLADLAVRDLFLVFASFAGIIALGVALAALIVWWVA
jgi:hypothetical protein